MQCQVIATGRAESRATRAPSYANGETTPACTCTTSGAWVGEQPAHPGHGRRVDRQVEREPGAQPVHGHTLVVGDRTAPLTVRTQRGGQDVHLVAGPHLGPARSRTCVSIPPVRGA